MMLTASSTSATSDQLIDACRILACSGILGPSGHGNMSVRLSQDTFLMTGNTLVDISRDNLAAVSIASGQVSGHLSPTDREIVGMHTVVYTARPEVQCVLHTHSPFVTALAVARRGLPCVTENLGRWGVFTEVPVVGFGVRGDKHSVQLIDGALRTQPDVPEYLLANHGLLIAADSVTQAVALAFATEEAACAFTQASQLGGAQPLSPAEAKLAWERRITVAAEAAAQTGP